MNTTALQKPEHLQIRKETHAEIIEIGLFEILSTQAACHLVTKRFLDIQGYPWIPMDAHGHPWMSMDINRYPWISIDIHCYPWISMISLVT